MYYRRLAVGAFCCLAFVAGIGAIAVVAGAPPPTQLCGTCGADEIGATEPGTLEINIDEHGDSQWTERVPVNDSAAEQYRDNPDTLEDAVDDAWNDVWHIVDEPPETIDRTETLEDETVVVTYAIDDIARPGVRNTWIVEYFGPGIGPTRYDPAAERVTIHTPDGTSSTNDPWHATVEDNTATWAVDAADTTEIDDPTISDFDRTYITYGQSDGALETACSYATIGHTAGPVAFDIGLVGGLAPGFLLVATAIAVGRIEREKNAFDAPRLEQFLVVAGAGGSMALLGLNLVTVGWPLGSGVGTLIALGLGYAALGVVPRRCNERHSTRGVLALTTLVTVGTGGLLVILDGLIALVVLPFGFATALFLPIGFAAERHSSPLVSLCLGVLASVALFLGAVAVAALVVPWGNSVFLYWFLLLVVAAIVVGCGYPFVLLGKHIAASTET